MKLIPYTDHHDVQHFIDISKVMFTDTFIIAIDGEPDAEPIKGTRICIDSGQGGYVYSKEPSDVIWDRINAALSE